MNDISLQVGNENQIGAALKVQAFRVHGNHREEIHASKPSLEGDDASYSITNKSSATAISDQPWLVGGGWTTINAKAKEGVMFKYHVHRAPTVGMPCVFGFVVRMRASAPLIEVRVPGLFKPRSTLTHVTAFFGRADILTLDEAKAAGYPSKPPYERFFDHPDQADTLEIKEIAPGRAADPVEVIKSKDRNGNEVVVMRKRELRRIRRRPAPGA